MVLRICFGRNLEIIFVKNCLHQTFIAGRVFGMRLIVTVLQLRYNAGECF